MEEDALVGSMPELLDVSVPMEFPPVTEECACKDTAFPALLAVEMLDKRLASLCDEPTEAGPVIAEDLAVDAADPPLLGTDSRLEALFPLIDAPKELARVIEKVVSTELPVLSVGVLDSPLIEIMELPLTLGEVSRVRGTFPLLTDPPVLPVDEAPMELTVPVNDSVVLVLSTFVEDEPLTLTFVDEVPTRVFAVKKEES